MPLGTCRRNFFRTMAVLELALYTWSEVDAKTRATLRPPLATLLAHLRTQYTPSYPCIHL